MTDMQPFKMLDVKLYVKCCVKDCPLLKGGSSSFTRTLVTHGVLHIWQLLIKSFMLYQVSIT